MTPAEQEEIFNAAFDCYTNVIIVVVSSIAGGIATLGILIVIQLLKVETWREPRAIQRLCCIVIWLCLMGQNIALPIAIFGQIRFSIENRIPTPILALSLDITNNIQIALGSVIVLAGDLVIYWRAWVLLPHDKFWRFVLAIIMICNIGLNIADLIFDIERPQLLLSTALDLVSVAISLIVNMTATSLIGWKAWAHYRTIRKVSVWRKSHVQKILLFLMESGAVFLAIQLLALIGLVLVVSPLPAVQDLDTITLVGNIGEQVWQASAALYPIAIIILIHSDHSPIVETLHLTTQPPILSVPQSMMR
ncbi:hypothetical protein BDP27DRAFT_1322279 [Rhodocollybia butyracea]|uniref:Uncharacterized protein n=1 Tax=Rhodocollybia butyracea TaxID=206335 RepID=A0A9P5PS64_9AGAR|nr:hypothetical protein BDP27DRAFT_1322279 [Rhodocollybia butyracea]